MFSGSGRRSYFGQESIVLDFEGEKTCKVLLLTWGICIAIAFFLFLLSFLVYSYFKKMVVIVNSRYWNRMGLWGSISTNNLLLLELTSQNREGRFTIIRQPYSNKLRWRVITHYDCTQSPFRFLSRIMTMTTFYSWIRLCNKRELDLVRPEIL